MNKIAQDRLAELKTKTAAQTNAVLTTSLELLVALDIPEQANRLAMAVICDELENRNPALHEALELWATAELPDEDYEAVVLRFAADMDPAGLRAA